MTVVAVQTFPGHRVGGHITLEFGATNSKLCFVQITTFQNGGYLSESKENSSALCVE